MKGIICACLLGLGAMFVASTSEAATPAFVKYLRAGTRPGAQAGQAMARTATQNWGVMKQQPARGTYSNLFVNYLRPGTRAGAQAGGAMAQTTIKNYKAR